MEGNWARIRFQGRKGAFNIIDVGLQDHILSQAPSFTHRDNAIGYPSSLSDKKPKEEGTSVSGLQVLSVLSQIQGCTYEHPDLQQRRLGLIANEVEDAIDLLATDNVMGSKWHDGEQYETLDDSRVVALLIPAIPAANSLSARVNDLDSIVNGTSS